MTLAKSAAYVRSCYSENDNTASGGCNFFVQPFLESDRASEYVNSSCTCPFGNNACTKDPICFDSGAISSSKDLGINLPETETITVRRVTTCAPIDADRYATPWIDDVTESSRDGDAPSNTSVRYYQMGKGKEGCYNLADEWYQKNELPENNLTTTFCVAKSSRRYLPSAYTIAAQTVYLNKEDASDFIPIPDFAPVESDVTLMSLLNKADYTQEVDDPLFFAHNKSAVSAEATFLTASHDLSVLGCTEKYQVCNTANRLCTPLTGQYAVRQSIANNTLQLSPQQTATFTLLSDGIWAMSLQWAFKVLGADLLLAKDWIYTIDSSGSSGLPPDQWHREVENLHNMSLATLQRRVAEFANPSAFDVSPEVSSIEQIRSNTPTDPLLRSLCDLQKIRSSNHYSVSVLGMAIILGVGSVLILLDWVFIQQIFWWRGGRRLAKRLDWQSTGTLQLYRLALEARGVGPWDSHDYDFPILMDGEKKFRPLTEAEGGAEMARLDPSQGQQYGYGGGYVNNFGGNTAYDGGKYSVLPSQKGSETDVKIGEAK
ncbi:hypothetical protein BS50DRAFT_486076 [Corynespora cassiicola Philippines]|uniref:Uncharacterized protein n=1 Tax=Corynespora cassiicola Philippines TaxID=1448308 RepID=A0A2T2NZ68_CORCC|nr:hypothetical protein BS50DRAFT_486076 [Corynespora cassiicola Philippines]